MSRVIYLIYIKRITFCFYFGFISFYNNSVIKVFVSLVFFNPFIESFQSWPPLAYPAYLLSKAGCPNRKNLRSSPQLDRALKSSKLIVFIVVDI